MIHFKRLPDGRDYSSRLTLTEIFGFGLKFFLDGSMPSAPHRDAHVSTGLIDSINRRTQLAGYNRLALLLFRLGGPELFGINVFKVQEVVQAPELTWVPAAHSHVRGVAPVRGRMIPVLDLAAAVQTTPPGSEPRYLIVSEFNRRGKWGQVLQNNILTLIHCVEQYSSSLYREPLNGRRSVSGSHLLVSSLDPRIVSQRTCRPSPLQSWGLYKVAPRKLL